MRVASIHAESVSASLIFFLMEAGKRADLLFFDIEEPAELAYWVGGVPPSRIIRATA